MFENYFMESNLNQLFDISIRIAAIFILLAVFLKLFNGILEKTKNRIIKKAELKEEAADGVKKRAETLFGVIYQVVFIASFAVSIVMSLREAGFDIGPLIASAGVVGLAIGLGAQNLLRDIIAGFFLILENRLRIGDVVVLNGQGGAVEEVNYRTIVIRDLHGTVHVFPSGEIKTISNMTLEWSAFVFSIGISYKEDADRVIKVMKSVGDEIRKDEAFSDDIIEDIEIFGIDEFADSSVIIKGRIKTKPIKQWGVGREYRRRLKIAFDREGIEIPYPQRSIHTEGRNSYLPTKTVDQEPEKRIYDEND